MSVLSFCLLGPAGHHFWGFEAASRSLVVSHAIGFFHFTIRPLPVREYQPTSQFDFKTTRVDLPPTYLPTGT